MVRWRNLGLKGVPIIFANSFPKSGTHLLTQVISGLSLVGPAVKSGLPAIQTFHGNSGKRRQDTEILEDLNRLLPGDTAYGHLHAMQRILDFFSKQGTACFFILRDPRDVVVSHVYYVTEMEPDHVHHEYYANTLQSFDQRLRASIIGRQELDIEFGNIANRFQPYLGWLTKPEILVLRYEDFLTDQTATIRRILEHSVLRGFPLHMNHENAVKILEAQLDPHRSPTFRSGKAGGWKEAFTEENKVLFKDIAGELLIKLGYENDFTW